MNIAVPTRYSESDVDIRLRADESTRRPVLFFFTLALFWLLAGSFFGLISSFKMHLPDWLVTQPWLTFGRLRTAHLNVMVYGWASLAMIGTTIWILPRLLHTVLRWPWLTIVGGLLWNAGLVSGIWFILIGINDGMEWLEMPRYWAVPYIVAGGALIAVSLFGTLARHRVEHLYVSVWYMVASFIWFPVIFIAGKIPTLSGVESAGTNWFYAHNALGLWLTAISLGAIYYLLPKVLGRPVHSYQLSLLGFWSLAFFYALNGMHHLVGGPLPTWMITTSIVASVLMVIPVLSTAVNHHFTMIGRFTALRYSPTLRFIVLGAIAYTAVSLQGTFTALREVNRITHFTQWTIAHSHVGLYAFVTFVMFGSMYYIMPRVARSEWPSAVLIRWHFWLALFGIAAYVIALTVAGLAQGLALLDPTIPFQVSVERTIWGLIVRSITAVILTLAHVIFVVHFLWICRRPDLAHRIPPLHGARPILHTGVIEGEG